MNCAMKHVSAGIYACARAHCGRIVRVETKLPVFTCNGEGAPGEIPSETRALAEKIAAAPVLGKRAGPGFELKKLLLSVGYSEQVCGCAATAAKMNSLGPDGCRREIGSLCEEVVSNAKKLGVDIDVTLARWAIEEAIRLCEVSSSI